MVSKAYRTCLLLIEKMVKHGYIHQISRIELGIIISRYVGADQRTIDKYARVCVQQELLTPHPANKEVYYINLMKTCVMFKEVFGHAMKQLTLEQTES